MGKKARKEIKNCLFRKRTSDKEAVRRHLYADDEDAFILNFGSPYLVDAQQKIILSKAFRRLSFKTQVMTAASNAHVRTRASHTYEVVSIATLIARILGLNENLCYAIALGHDNGHAPLGHPGEEFISKIAGKEFRHEVFGVVVAQKIERKGKGLNLTRQVLEGILRHSRGSGDLSVNENVSQEANAVMFADKIAYIWADINDIFVRTRVLNLDDYSELKELVGYFGKNQRERYERSIKALCCESAGKGEISFADSSEAKAFLRTKELMYGIYDLVSLQNVTEILGRVYDFLKETKIMQGIDPAIALALMTDNDVLTLHSKKAINAEDFYHCSVSEMIPYLKGKNIDFTNPDLDPDLDW